MENIIKKPYEISLWEDVLVFRVEYYDKTTNELVKVKEYMDSLANFEAIENTITKINQYYKERKLCIIGSNTLTSPIRAVKPKLNSKINGQNTLTFTMYLRYWNDGSGGFEDNPYIGLLVNERKVKLKHDDKWYDFIIKEIKEDSNNKTVEYTCKDLFINELSKSGFSLQFDPKLENNMGNITYLAEKILEESDWRIAEKNDTLVQTLEEPLYRIKTNRILKYKDMQDTSGVVKQFDGPVDIYVFYSNIAEKSKRVQFLYVPGTYQTDDDRIITNSPNYVLVDETTYINDLPVWADDSEGSVYFEPTMRGKKLVQQAITRFDAKLDKYVNVYKKKGSEKLYYGYTKSEYVTPTSVKNYITNGESFISTSGWEVGADSNEKYPDLKLFGYKELKDDKTIYRTFLRYVPKDGVNTILYNSGFADNRSAIHDLTVGEEYIVDISASYLNNNIPVSYNKDIKIDVGEYSLEDGKYLLGRTYFSGTITGSGSKALKSQVAVSYNELVQKRIGIFLSFPGATTDVLLEKVQFYKKIEYVTQDENGQEITAIAYPGGPLYSFARTMYYYYDPDSEYTDIDSLVYDYVGYKDSENYEKQYNDDLGQFEKVRSITASESNRFNLIQDLCEIFECWAKFTIEHEADGTIKLDNNFQQLKWVSFHEYVGVENYSGFKYGINLNSIQRTINSDAIVSKIIVKNNVNEFAPDGFCSIGRAIENPSKENFIFNFEHYISQGLLKQTTVYNDLYSQQNGYLGYYKQLRALNDVRDELANLQAQYSKDLMEYEAQQQTYKVSLESAQEELQRIEQQILSKTGMTVERLRETNSTWLGNQDVIALIEDKEYLEALVVSREDLFDIADGYLKDTQALFDKNEEEIKALAEQKKKLNLQFYKKYSRFIQEGSWISEDYVDDNLYYMDAHSTLANSAKPKISYSIKVVEISQLEGYENYDFQLGDKSFIEDTEFFGWVYKEDGEKTVKTPYHEEVVVSEITWELDSPESNSIKIQNFKTQFEDLFQRITASTQALEFHTGEYSKAASIVDPNGAIKPDVLKNSLSNNSFVISNARDQSVVIDDKGITTTSLAEPNQMVRIVSGGIMLSNDGGDSWRTGITASGINADYLKSGLIDTSRIVIGNGAIDSFRWDQDGINAYAVSFDEDGKAIGFNDQSYVRFDQYGLYGIKGITNFVPSSEEDVWDNANFALTWKGFQIKNKHGDGYVSIDSINDFVVNDGSVNRIKIGNIGTSDAPTYGIRISDKDNIPVLETDNDGKLWLRDSLKVGTTQTSNVEIGYLSKYRTETTEGKEKIYHQVISAGDASENEDSPFIVYEDGKVIAKNIEVRGGKIGNMTIAELEGGDKYEVQIISRTGTNIKQGSTVTLIAKLYSGSTEKTNFKCEWLNKDSGTIIDNNDTTDISEDTKTITIKGVDFGTDGFTRYGCRVTLIEET